MKAERGTFARLLPQVRADVFALLDVLWAYPPYHLLNKSRELEALDQYFCENLVDALMSAEAPYRDFFFHDLTAAFAIPFGIYSLAEYQNIYRIPAMESTYIFAGNPSRKEKLGFVQRVRFHGMMRFHCLDWINSLHRGHAPACVRIVSGIFSSTTDTNPNATAAWRPRTAV